MTDLSPEHYRDNSSFQYDLAQEVMKLLSLKGDESILDVGCGDGRVTGELAKWVPQGQITGVDPSNAMIQYAKSHFPKIDFFVGNAEAFHLKHKFDLITCLSAAHWFRNPKKAFCNIANHLIPGGEFLMLTYPRESPYWNLFAKTERNPEWAPYTDSSALKAMQTSDAYITLLEECGFRIEEKYIEEKIASYATKEELKTYIKGFIACHITLPEPLYDTYLDQLVEQIESVEAIPYVTLTLRGRLESDRAS